MTNASGTTVAFLGLGRMGSRMATNLAAAGHDVVLHNRTRETADTLAGDIGATVAGTPSAAVDGADVVITMLANEHALRAVCTGPDGVLAGLRRGTVVADMGTTGPAGVRWLDEEVRAAGGSAVDAPVSGSTDAAASAGLTIMVGGPSEAVARVEPVLRSMGSRVYHLGDTGSGTVAKLAVNNIIYALGNAVSESLVLAERHGLDRATMYDVFEHSAVAAPMVGYRRQAFLHPDATPPAFAMTLASKDLGLITDLAAAVGLPVAQADANRELIDRAVLAGFGDRDMADVAVHLREL